MSRFRNAFLESDLSVGLLAKDTAFYGIVAAISKLSMLILVPILTRSLSMHEFGVVDTLLMITNCALLIGNAGIDSALMFFYYNVPDEERSRYVATGFWLRMSLGLLVTLIGMGSASLTTRFVFGSGEYGQWTTLSFIVVPFTLAVTYSLDVLRIAHERSWFLILSLSRIFILIAGTWWVFAGSIEDKVSTFLVLRVVPDLITACILLVILGRRYRMFSVSREALIRVLRYGSPFLPATLMYWMLGFVDRWFLYQSGFEGEVGLYALSVKMGLVLTLFATAIQMAFNPFSMAVKDHEKSTGFYSRSFGLTMASLVVLVLGIAANLEWLVRLVGGGGYETAVLPASILLVGNMFYVACVFFSTGTNIQGKTVYHIYSYGAALVVSIVLCAFLVPRFGATGAALSVSVANIVLAAVTLFFAQRVHPIAYGIARASIGIVLTAVAVFAFSSYNSDSSIVVIALKNCAGVVVAGVAARTILVRHEWDKVVAKAISFRG